MSVPLQDAPPLPVEEDREGHARSGARSARLLRAARTEAALFRLGVGVVAVHLVDDSFLQPQPGTSAGDHLVSGLVPVAVLLAAIAFVPRLRPGLRAAVAATIGVFGAVAAVEAVYYAHAGHLSGDDYTGLAAIPAALFLISSAVGMLWRTRRVDDGRLRRWVRRLLIAAAAAVATYVVVAPFLASYVLTHTARAFVPTDRVGAAHEDVAFTTADGRWT